MIERDEGYFTQQYQLNKQIQQLEKENAELKIANREFTDDYNLQQKAINTLNDSGLELMEENKKLKAELEICYTGKYIEVIKENADLKSKLANQKYLDRQEVEKIVGSNVFFDEDGDVTEVYPEDIVTAICSLALPQVRTSSFTDEQKEVDLSESFYNPEGGKNV